MYPLKRITWAMFGLLLVGVVPCRAATYPFTENFATDTANWRQNASANSPTWVSTGGPSGAGDTFISYTFTMSPTNINPMTGTGFSSLFRGHDDFDASGDAFVGVWPTTVSPSISFNIRHNASVPLYFGVRVADSFNGSGASAPVLTSVPANTWTHVEIPISLSAWFQEGPPFDLSSFKAYFNSGIIGNLQIVGGHGSDLPTDVTSRTITFDLDDVQLVPEPSSFVLAGMGILCGLVAFRYRGRKARLVTAA